jgi:hypothetical protein
LREIKKKESRLFFPMKIELYLNRFIHHISNLWIMFLPYVFKPKLILYVIYEVYLLLTLYSWYLLRECPISIHEKQILDTNYVNGDSDIHPFISLIIPTRIFIFCFLMMYTINLLLISYVLFYNKNKLVKLIELN